MHTFKQAVAILGVALLLPAYAAQADIPIKDVDFADEICEVRGNDEWVIVRFYDETGAEIDSFWECAFDNGDVIVCDNWTDQANCVIKELDEDIANDPALPAAPGVFEVAPVSPSGAVPGVYVVPGATIIGPTYEYHVQPGGTVVGPSR